MATPDLIADARELGAEPESLLEACEAIWGHGVADEQAGSATEPPHVHIFRVAHCVVRTGEAGLRDLYEFQTEQLARLTFERWAAELETDDDEEQG